MNIVTPSFRLELTPIARTAEAPSGAGTDAAGADAAGSPARDMLDAAAGAIVAVALGTASLPQAPAADVETGGWARVRVRSGVCGFRADFEARMQVGSLRRFERELGALQEGAVRTGRAELACDEPGVDLRLEVREPGAIAGHFALESQRRSGAWTTLSGTFELDPQALPEIRASIVALLRALEG
jgi:hypothetical protein